jgi:Xaa-Pro aminopeptidase
MRSVRFPRLALALIALVSIAPARGQDAKPSEQPQLLAQPRADYQARRRALIESLAKEGNRSPVVAVLRGGDDTGKEDFEEGRFRQGNDFAYLTGVDTPGAWLVVLPKSKTATLYLPPKSGFSVMNGENRNFGPGKEAAEALGFDAVEPTSKLLGDLFAAIADPMRPNRFGGGGSIVYLAKPNAAALDARPDAKFTRFLREGAPGTSFRDIAPVIGELRKIKTPTEIALLQKAIDITGEANEEVIRTIKPDLFEYQLEAKIQGAFMNGGAMRPGFASIVGSGPNGTIPHYFANNRKMLDGELVVVDIGAEYELYTADVTRTYPVNGKFTSRQRELYQLVLDAQAATEESMRKGETELGGTTQFVMGYLRKSPLRAKDADGSEHTMDHYLIHGVSHYLGMDVHDVGSYAPPLKPGAVFTIEPGLYIKTENIGIRIEDDYLMTDSGLVKLTKNIASDPAEIEAKIARARKKE